MTKKKKKMGETEARACRETQRYITHCIGHSLGGVSPWLKLGYGVWISEKTRSCKCRDGLEERKGETTTAGELNHSL